MTYTSIEPLAVSNNHITLHRTQQRTYIYFQCKFTTDRNEKPVVW